MNDLLIRFRLLPLLVLVAMIAFGVRMGETVADVRSLTASAMAEETAHDNKKPTEEDIKALATDDPKPSVQNQPKVSLPESTLPEVWSDPATQDMADTPEQMRLLEDLAKRRQQLDAREKALDTRDALMRAAEKQMDSKISEMTSLKDQIEKLLGQQETQENEKIQSLVKIYEGMKPKDAAAIFNQMDMNVLLQVIGKMSERKVSPIVAAMDTSKANELTVRLTEMKRLPDKKQNGFMGANAAPIGGGPSPTPAPAGSAPLPGLDALGAR